MKFCAGWFDGEIWLNQTQDGTSFGVYEISAKNNNVPTKSRMRAKTSLQALCLSVRATASDSNSMPASFNLVVAALAAALAPALDHNREQSAILTTRPRHGERAVLAPYPLAFGLQTTSDADYCATDHASFSCEGGVYSLRHCRDRRLFLRKASARSNAGSTAGTARSSKSLVERDKEKF